MSEDVTGGRLFSVGKEFKFVLLGLRHEVTARCTRRRTGRARRTGTGTGTGHTQSAQRNNNNNKLVIMVNISKCYKYKNDYSVQNGESLCRHCTNERSVTLE